MHVDVHGGLFREITCQTRHAILRAMVHDHEDDVQSRDPAEDRPAAGINWEEIFSSFSFSLLLHIHSSGNFIAAATS